MNSLIEYEMRRGEWLDHCAVYDQRAEDIEYDYYQYSHGEVTSECNSL